MAEDSWTIGKLLTWTTEFLQKHGTESPRLDAEVLLAAAKGCQRIELYTSFTDIASEELRTTFRALVKRRSEGTPVAYLVGHREFYSLDFDVTPDVLIPRPETEQLVVEILDRVKLASSPETLSIADVGTGSGAIAVSLAVHSKCSITAIDVSPVALAIARKNAAQHKVAERIRFVESDLFASIPATEMFSLIASNPPYVTADEYAKLPKEVKDHEPRLALEAGPLGTEVIARLAEQAATQLVSGGELLMEVSPMIEPAVRQLLQSHGAYEVKPTVKDFAGKARIVIAQRKT